MFSSLFSDKKPFTIQYTVYQCDHLKCREKYLKLGTTNVLRKPDKLMKVFESHFREFAGKERNTARFTNPFLITDREFNFMHQTEITDLKFNPAMKRKFDQMSAAQKGKRRSEFGAS